MLLASHQQAISWGHPHPASVTSQDVCEAPRNGSADDEMEHAADGHLCEDIENGMVDGFTARG